MMARAAQSSDRRARRAALGMLRQFLPRPDGMSPLDAGALITALTDPRTRDMAIKELLGDSAGAEQLVDDHQPDHWSPDLLEEHYRRGCALLNHLVPFAKAAGGTYRDTVQSMLAYLHWAGGRPLAALSALSAVPPGYQLADLLRSVIATGGRP